MTLEAHRPVLKDKKALVVGVANDSSIAYGCAKAFAELGAQLAITYLNDKAKDYVAPLASELVRDILAPLDVSRPGELEALFERIRAQWSRLDLLVHSIAFAPKEDLQGGLLDCSAEGFAKAMDVSCHSFVRMARLAAPLMTEGGAMFAMSYHGAEGRAQLQRHGTGEGGARGVLPVSRVRARPKDIACTRCRPVRSRRAASGLKDFDLLSTRPSNARRSASSSTSPTWDMR